MYSTIFVGFVFLFIECITGVQCDDRVIIGSSVGGFVGLVSEDEKQDLFKKIFR
jgi:hypothetical protein